MKLSHSFILSKEEEHINIDRGFWHIYSLKTLTWFSARRNTTSSKTSSLADFIFFCQFTVIRLGQRQRVLMLLNDDDGDDDNDDDDNTF